MNTFNTFGAGYTLRFALTALTARGNEQSRREIKELLTKKYGKKPILTYKCREALELALRSCHFPKGGYVAICQYSCKEVIGAIEAADLRPAFVKLAKGTLHFSAATLKTVLLKNPKIRAVLVQNTLGYPCDIDGIVDMCRRNKLVLIEDLAHCVGGLYENGKEMGSFGDFVALSFSQNKIIDSVSGGALIVRNPKFNVAHPTLAPNWRRQLADRIYPLCAYFLKHSYPLYTLFQKLITVSKSFTNTGSGVHSLPSWYCVLILAKFRNLPSAIFHRRKIASVYARSLNKNILSSALTKQIPYSAHFRFPIFVTQKKSLVDYLAQYHFYLDDPWYTLPGLTLPVHENISEERAEQLALAINEFINKSKHSGMYASE